MHLQLEAVPTCCKIVLGDPWTNYEPLVGMEEGQIIASFMAEILRDFSDSIAFSLNS